LYPHPPDLLYPSHEQTSMTCGHTVLLQLLKSLTERQHLGRYIVVLELRGKVTQIDRGQPPLQFVHTELLQRFGSGRRRRRGRRRWDRRYRFRSRCGTCRKKTGRSKISYITVSLTVYLVQGRLPTDLEI